LWSFPAESFFFSRQPRESIKKPIFCHFSQTSWKCTIYSVSHCSCHRRDIAARFRYTGREICHVAFSRGFQGRFLFFRLPGLGCEPGIFCFCLFSHSITLPLSHSGSPISRFISCSEMTFCNKYLEPIPRLLNFQQCQLCSRLERSWKYEIQFFYKTL
jgi:hypothetical protein